MSAYVEIIFDNTDNRFPTGKDEVILRRTIGLKKDEYSLDKKSASKSDIMNLLESAGFSRSNPYYIVPQGRVTTLTNAKDSERLNLLKEVAGTQVYEQRRTESLKIMDETTQKRNKINDLLKYIEERLSELEEEKEELREFQEADKERRCLEYTIHSREQNEVNAALEEIEDSRITGLNSNDDRRDTFVQRELQITERDTEIASLRQQIELLNLEKAQLEQDRREQYKLQTHAELSISRMEDEADISGARAQTSEKELHALESTISKRESTLSALLPEYEQLKQDESATKLQLEKIEAQANHLYSKQGRNARFKNKSERNKYIDTEIKDLESNLSQRESHKTDFVKEVEEMQEMIARNLEEVEEIRAQIEGRKDALDDLARTADEAKEQRDTLSDQRKELWREEAKTQSSAEIASENVKQAEGALRSTMDRSTSMGLAAAKRIASEQNLTGYYGPLYELFEVDDRYRTAVELIAGNSLFHIVVDTDETASVLLEGINKAKAGRVTFVPLNRIRVQPTTYPTANDAVPMLQKIRFEETHRKAFEQVFGKSIICPNLEVASRYARTEGLNAITLAGDKSDRRGALTGGFHDHKRSRLESAKKIKKWQTVYDAAQTSLQTIRRKLLTIDQEITRAMSTLQKSEQKRKAIEENREPLQRMLQQKAKAEGTNKEALARKELAVLEIDSDIQKLQTAITSLKAERATDFKKDLTAEEESTLLSLNAEIEALTRQFSELSSRRMEMEGQRRAIESELRDNLYLKRDQLRNQNSIEVEATSLDAQRSVRDRALKAISAIAKKIEACDSSLEELEGDLQTNEQERADLEQQNRDDARVIEKQQKGLEKNMQKRSLLMSKKDECSKNIRDLGVLPEEAFTKFTNAQSNTLVKRLHKVNESLKKFSHVNKKAYDQYSSFTKQRDDLEKRHAELETSQASIAELIDTLDLRKDEAIERTFKQVSKAFSEIFSRLVPAGHGRLIIQRRVDQDEEDANTIENYVGVAISVSFTSQSSEHRIQQLSGGQKSLCALALIFAIQKCDPAPFYLLDEVDAALDAQYRTSIASLIQELSANGQFICTTFRPEMVSVAETFFGVIYASKISTVKNISKEDAVSFIEAETR